MDDHPGGDEVLLSATGNLAITCAAIPLACYITLSSKTACLNEGLYGD